MTSPSDRAIYEAAERYKLARAQRAGRRKSKLRRGPGPKAKTIDRGEERHRDDDLPVYCQHSDDGVKCWNATLARDPLERIPACRMHYQRAYRRKTGKR